MSNIEPLQRFHNILHDKLGTVIGLMKITEKLISELRKQNSPQTELAETLEVIIKRHYLELRSISLNIEMPHLEEENLSNSIRIFFSRLQTNEQLLQIEIDDTIDQFPKISDAFFTVAKEGIVNAILHGDAKIISIEVKRQRGFFKLTVKDNGHGFDVEQVLKWSNGGTSHIKNLIDTFNGTFVIKSDKDTGTVLTVTIPSQEKLP